MLGAAKRPSFLEKVNAALHSFAHSGIDEPWEQKELGDLALEYAWSEVKSATGDFAQANRLGSGTSGTVYRGTLQEGIQVAIKLIDGLVGGGFEEEVRTLSRCRHPNVVMLLGFAQEAGHTPAVSSSATPISRMLSRDGNREGGAKEARRALVYELLTGGDVFSRLQSHTTSYSYNERLKTAIDVARGLTHLHKLRPEIFHRDIKTQNIIFGADGAAKIADFGIACVSQRRGLREHTVDATSGTPGYVDPLYMRTGVVTEANEVYSMGMVLIELLTASPPAILSPDGRGCVYLNDELRLQEANAKHRVLGRLDSRAGWPSCIAASLTTLALLCIHEDADRRPSFLDLASILQDILATGVNELLSQSSPDRLIPQGGLSHVVSREEPGRAAVPPVAGERSQPPKTMLRVGDELEVWSTTFSRWMRATVEDVGHAEQHPWLSVSYRLADGSRATKEVPYGHQHLRGCGYAAQAANGRQPQSSWFEPSDAAPEIGAASAAPQLLGGQSAPLWAGWFPEMLSPPSATPARHLPAQPACQLFPQASGRHVPQGADHRFSHRVGADSVSAPAALGQPPLYARRL
eukprot:TRINITY_DN20810_c0_g2_i1.p1 TRINITY_DN20810_c0_g2~~TRINITY_DN20810_c0_g2_i1.p1  ORF type:complete len:578 (-),score=87.39 TRINITY_DN20810_c0_g2_i1:15-1748(-)